jgi:hypothetical protein
MRAIDDIKYGIKSGYKPCCIAWFVLIWCPFLKLFHLDNRHGHWVGIYNGGRIYIGPKNLSLIAKIHKFWTARGIGYIPCPWHRFGR